MKKTMMKGNLSSVSVRKVLGAEMSDEDWVRCWSTDESEIRWSYTDALIDMHAALHRDQADRESVNDLILDIERRISSELASRGYPERYDDALAKQAGTFLDPPPPVSIYEITGYLRTVGLDSQAIVLVEALSDASSSVRMSINSPLLKGLEDSIVRAVNAPLPPLLRMSLKDTSGEGGDFIVVQPAFSLDLVPNYWETPRTTMASTLIEKKAVHPFNIIKKKMYPMSEYIVTGAVLVPEEPDGTIDIDEETGDVRSHNDIYDEESIQKAMYHWMEESHGTFALMHTDDGGITLTDDDVALLENWQARANYTEGEQLITKGTWMKSIRVKSPVLKEKCENGEINSFSVGMSALGEYVKVSADAEPS